MTDSVKATRELERIRLLPSRHWAQDYDLDGLVQYMTESLKTPWGTMTLRPHQAVALAELHDYGGWFLPLDMGLGKTLLSLLAPVVAQSKRPLLLVPANLRKKTEADMVELAEHWQLPPAINLQSYETLGVDKEGYLEEKTPDLIVCDEADALKDTSTSRWKKINRYVRDSRKAGYDVKLLPMSGTAIGRHLGWFWHLLRLSLGDLAPVPARWPDMMEWATVLDAKRPWGALPMEPGALLRLGAYDSSAPPQDQARQAFGDRLSRTPGIVSVQGDQVGVEISIEAKILDLPETLEAHFAKLREEWRTPDDQPFERPVDLWRHARTLASGLYLIWAEPAPEEWLRARTEWGQYMREVLRGHPNLDSPSELTLAIDRGEFPDPEGCLARWREIKDTFRPNTIPVWEDDTALEACAEWLEREQGVCWVEHKDFGIELERLTGIPLFAAYGRNSDGVQIDKHKGPAIAQQKTCFKGFNLQYLHHKMLIASMTPTGEMYDQSIAREHRPGQVRDVEITHLFGCIEQLRGFEQARRDVANKEYMGRSSSKLGQARVRVPGSESSGLTGWAWARKGEE